MFATTAVVVVVLVMIVSVVVGCGLFGAVHIVHDKGVKFVSVLPVFLLLLWLLLLFLPQQYARCTTCGSGIEERVYASLSLSSSSSFFFFHCWC